MLRTAMIPPNGRLAPLIAPTRGAQPFSFFPFDFPTSTFLCCPSPSCLKGVHDRARALSIHDNRSITTRVCDRSANVLGSVSGIALINDH